MRTVWYNKSKRLLQYRSSKQASKLIKQQLSFDFDCLALRLPVVLKTSFEDHLKEGRLSLDGTMSAAPAKIVACVFIYSYLEFLLEI